MEIKLLSGALGAEIKGIDLTDVSDENFKKINDLLLEHAERASNFILNS
jgi:taurine dioxygenase